MTKLKGISYLRELYEAQHFVFSGMVAITLGEKPQDHSDPPPFPEEAFQHWVHRLREEQAAGYARIRREGGAVTVGQFSLGTLAEARVGPYLQSALKWIAARRALKMAKVRAGKLRAPSQKPRF